jgi:hypothetical protein
MERPHRIGLTITASFVALIAGLLGVPFLAISTGSGGMPHCPLTRTTDAAVATADGTPSILGPSTLTVAQLVDWWDTDKARQPARLSIPIHDAIALYLSEAATEGVRGDIMFAQSIVETGSFSNSDTSINNFAGIGHYDNRDSEFAYPNAQTGIRAQVQLLKKFAADNDVELINTDLGVNAGRHTTTWGGLAGTWATALNYWEVIQDVYTDMLTHNGLDPSDIAAATPTSCAPYVGMLPPITDDTGRAWSVPVSADAFNPDQLDDPHHDYPAWDLIIPEGTPIHAVTDGIVASIRNWPHNWWRSGCGRDPTGCDTCGVGITIQSDNGLRHTYCHNTEALVTLGDQVTAGQQIALSGDTGRSGTPHLHLEFRINNTQYCPQPIVAALYAGSPGPFTWTATGCVHG